MQEQLYHLFNDSKEEFFMRIDEFGGWPHSAKSVVMKHTGVSGERPCYFCLRENIRDEWNTSLFTSDDYYVWKLSPNRIASLKREERSKIIRELGGIA